MSRKKEFKKELKEAASARALLEQQRLAARSPNASAPNVSKVSVRRQAHGHVNVFRGLEAADRARLRPVLLDAPLLVQREGLATAICYLMGKAAGNLETPHGRVLCMLEQQLTSLAPSEPSATTLGARPSPIGAAALKILIDRSDAESVRRRLERDAIRLLEHVKELADALLDLPVTGPVERSGGQP